MTPIELAEQYVNNTGISIFLTGKAGTGKTTFLKRIVANMRKRSVVLAPTGVAAINAGGVTIHSFFQLPFCPYLPDVKELVTEYQMPDKYKSLRKEKIKIIRTLDLLIIDEISMVRADLLDAVDMTLRRYRHNSRPFGGVQLLMIGDVQQLPPVVTDYEKPYMERVYPSPFFFHSKALKSLNYITIELTEIFRQQDALFVSLLNNIRDNRFDRPTLDALNARYKPGFNPDDSEGYIRLTTHNRQADSVNSRKLAALDSQPFELKAAVDGNFPETSFPTDATLTLKKGAQVMFVKNDSGGHEYYNGKIAIVEGFDPDEGVAVVDSDGNHIVVHRERWENIVYDLDASTNQIRQRIDGTFTQFPLKLAWAITIHKSQGLTFDRVVIDAAAAFTYGQVYVALSRCRTLEGLVLASPISERCLFDNDDIMQFCQSFDKPEVAESKLSLFRDAYFVEMFNDMFDFTALFHSAERLNALFQQHLWRLIPEQATRMGELCNGPVFDLTTVAEKFRKQVADFLSSHVDGTDAPWLNERIDKAVRYYEAQLEQIVLSLAPLIEVEMSNKAVAADFDDLTSELRDNLQLKLLCMRRVKDKGFSTAVYNSAKVDFLLDKEKGRGEKKQSYRKRAPKPKKEPTWKASVALFKEGVSINDIAERRSLAYTTITTHLQKGLEAGALKITDLMTYDELDEILQFIEEEQPESLNVMHDYFGDRYQYYKLRAARSVADGTVKAG